MDLYSLLLGKRQFNHNIETALWHHPKVGLMASLRVGQHTNAANSSSVETVAWGPHHTPRAQHHALFASDRCPGNKYSVLRSSACCSTRGPRAAGSMSSAWIKNGVWSVEEL